MDKQSFIKTPNITQDHAPVSRRCSVTVAPALVSTKFVASISADELFLPGVKMDDAIAIQLPCHTRGSVVSVHHNWLGASTVN